MHNMNRFKHFILFLIIILHSAVAFSCGYGYIGDCSTGVHLSINGTVDSFEVAQCPYLKSFDGLDLGSIQNLALVKATSITWESCTNNVTGVQLIYNIHKVNESPGNWLALNLNQDYHIQDGAYDTRYSSKSGNVNLLSGLSLGQDYILEVYFIALVDTIGNDFIPEASLKQDNNGKNYKIRFRYDGPNAPPFTVVTTLVQNLKCNGDQSGRAGVSVYGNQTNLFYQWSNVNSNFFAQYNLPAGSYTVTVSGINGYTQARTIVLTEPPALQLVLVQAPIEVGCAGTDTLYTTISATNKAQKPTYAWFKDGILVSTDSVYTTPLFPLINNLSVTIKDAQGCTETKNANLTITQYSALNLYLTVQNCTTTSSNDGALSALIFGGKSPYTVQWSNGASGDYLNQLAPGQYCVTITDAIQCSTINCATVTAPVASQEPSGLNSWTLQPNPARAGTEIIVKSLEKPAFIQFFNSNGQLLAAKVPQAELEDIPFRLAADLPVGMYWLVVQTAGKYSRQSLIVY